MVRNLDFVSECDDAFVTAMVVNIRPQIVTPGTIVVFEGEVGKGFYMI
jgi:hypothetical protein